MASTKIEFVVQMTCESCEKAVRESLKAKGVNSVDVNLKTGSVVIDTTLSIDEVQKLLSRSGRKAFVKGYSGSIAAVSILEAGDKQIQGVVRLMQISPKLCLVDGTIDGLKPGNYNVSVHECGDLSQGCESVGDVLNREKKEQNGRLYGDLGSVQANKDGRAAFRLEDEVFNLTDAIGRSLVISELKNNQRKRLACGIIARSAGLFQNPKMICACDGVSIWDERNAPKNKSSQL